MVLTTNELRRGNLIENNGNIYPITAIDHNSVIIFIKNATFCVSDKNINPIPLTEDWLLKFGFIQNTSNSYYWLNYGTNGILIVKYNDYYKKYTLELGKGMNIVLDFVHHFQNICFDLTRHELIIKQ
ncbi:MAG: hypothetical protein WC998_04800 [Candidatus Paceibacterota bacterium]|jgi:hypothetical protein